MNKVILTGNLTAEPEIRQTPNGINVARFVVAVQRRYQKDGERQADFITCVAWRNTAEFVYKYFQKGSGIAICGNLQTRSWTGDDGKRHYAFEVVCEEVNFNGGKKEGGTQTQRSAPAQSGGYAAEPKYRQETIDNAKYDDFADINFNEDDLPF